MAVKAKIEQIRNAFAPTRLFSARFAVAVFFILLSTQVPSALAHGTRSAQRLDSALSNITTKLSRIETKLRNLTGQIEELDQISKQNKKNVKEQYADSREAIKSMDRDITRLKRAIKRLASQTPLSRRKTKSKQINAVDLSKKTPAQLYNYALDQLKTKRKFSQAQKAFEIFVRQYPDNTRAGAALYWLGESFYVRGNFRDAASSYLRCYQTYPSGSKAADCLLRLGTALANLSEWDEACSSFDKLRSNFPAAPPHILQKLNSEYERIQCNSNNPQG